MEGFIESHIEGNKDITDIYEKKLGIYNHIKKSISDIYWCYSNIIPPNTNIRTILDILSSVKMYVFDIFHTHEHLTYGKEKCNEHMDVLVELYIKFLQFWVPLHIDEGKQIQDFHQLINFNTDYFKIVLKVKHNFLTKFAYTLSLSLSSSA